MLQSNIHCMSVEIIIIYTANIQSKLMYPFLLLVYELLRSVKSQLHVAVQEPFLNAIFE